MFCELDVRRKSIVTLSKDNHNIIIRYFVHRTPGLEGLVSISLLRSNLFARSQGQKFALDFDLEAKISVLVFVLRVQSRSQEFDVDLGLGLEGSVCRLTTLVPTGQLADGPTRGRTGALVCFSRAETLAYANFSFAGETLYRLYRLSLLAIETWQNLEIKTRPEITGLGLGTWTVNLRRDVLPAVSTQPSAVTHPRRRRAAHARQVHTVTLHHFITGVANSYIGVSAAVGAQNIGNQ